MYLRSFASWVALAVLSGPACALTGQGEATATPHANCSGVFRATVASGRAHPLLYACSDRITPEIAAVITEAARTPQPQYLARVFTFASSYRDPAIASAAIGLAEDGGAPAASQLLGWYLTMAQLRRTLFLRSLGNTPEEWFTRESHRCDWAEPTDGTYFRDHGTAPDFAKAVEHAARAVSDDATRPNQVRDYARCVLELLPAIADDEEQG